MLDLSSLRMFLAVLAGWLDLRQQAAMAYLIEENRIRPTRFFDGTGS